MAPNNGDYAPPDTLPRGLQGFICDRGKFIRKHNADPKRKERLRQAQIDAVETHRKGGMNKYEKSHQNQFAGINSNRSKVPSSDERWKLKETPDDVKTLPSMADPIDTALHNTGTKLSHEEQGWVDFAKAMLMGPGWGVGMAGKKPPVLPTTTRSGKSFE